MKIRSAWPILTLIISSWVATDTIRAESGAKVYTQTAKTYAQQLVEEVLAANPDLDLFYLHATPPGGKVETMVAGLASDRKTLAGAIGKPDSPEDLAMSKKGKVLLEARETIKSDNGIPRFEVDLALLDKANNKIGLLAIIFSCKPEEQNTVEAAPSLKFLERGFAIRNGLRDKIPNSAALFEPAGSS